MTTPLLALSVEFRQHCHDPAQTIISKNSVPQVIRSMAQTSYVAYSVIDSKAWLGFFEIFKTSYMLCCVAKQCLVLLC